MAAVGGRGGGAVEARLQAAVHVAAVHGGVFRTLRGAGGPGGCCKRWEAGKTSREALRRSAAIITVTHQLARFARHGATGCQPRRRARCLRDGACTLPGDASVCLTILSTVIASRGSSSPRARPGRCSSELAAPKNAATRLRKSPPCADQHLLRIRTTHSEPCISRSSLQRVASTSLSSPGACGRPIASLISCRQSQ